MVKKSFKRLFKVNIGFDNTPHIFTEKILMLVYQLNAILALSKYLKRKSLP